MDAPVAGEPVAAGEATHQDADDHGGSAGASARREYERRRDAREQRVRERFPRIGGFLLAVTDEPQSAREWDTGAAGEQVVGARLDALGSFRTRRVHVLWPGRLGQLLTGGVTARAGNAPAADVDVPSLRARIARAFPPA
ncbi:hypothetical protein [Terrabacter terrae]|uniref:hypothetical protein n=1 Tax=Terrabacter terrae TaxID=318434 RepID=UPI0031DD70CD